MSDTMKSMQDTNSELSQSDVDTIKRSFKKIADIDMTDDEARAYVQIAKDKAHNLGLASPEELKRFYMEIVKGSVS